MLNERGATTYFAHDGESSSVLDLTFINDKAYELDTIKDWSIDHHKAYGSDHAALTWTLDHERVPIENITAQRFNWKDIDEDTISAWKGAFMRELMDREDAWIPLRDSTRPNIDDIERTTTALQDALVQATESSIPTRKSSTHAKPWWTPDLTQSLNRIA
ncbi:hypothetical protein DEU56DRAFT_736331, partial [Suillus clintonianus]|uniref:uncharacterized protein n=1 Tax=Suillus clintonianus TaxID=1904413 RepID=UPI001B86612C